MPTPDLIHLFAAGRAEFNPARRKATCDQVQAILLDQVPICFLVKHTQAFAMRRNVQGFKNLPAQFLEEACLA